MANYSDWLICIHFPATGLNNKEKYLIDTDLKKENDYEIGNEQQALGQIYNKKCNIIRKHQEK